MLHHGRGFLVLVVLAGCGGDFAASDASSPTAPPPEAPPETPPAAIGRTTRSYEAAWGDVPNPERGGYVWIDVLRTDTVPRVRAAGCRLGFTSVSLAAYRSASIDAAFLSRLQAGLAAVRNAGIKMILRFKYSSAIGEADAPKWRILEHIGQLAPILQANADVIAVFQAGFIGAWGEWHGSTNRLDNPVDQGDVLRALLDALQASRMVQVRTPHDKGDILGREPLGDVEAWSGSSRARVGHHNDAFLASANDMGTYLSPVQAEKDWLALDSRFLPVGGEAPTVNSLAEGWPALQAMQTFHWSFVNFSYNKDVIARWQAQGHLEEIKSRLGYRLSLIEASWPEKAPPGVAFELSVRLRNSGFAAPYNPRPVFAVLSNADRGLSVPLDLDPRRWGPGSETSFVVRLRIPASLPPGTYRLALRLPDAAPSLQSRPEYAVAFANPGLWDASSGDNVLTEQFVVEAGVPGLADPDAVELADH